MSIIPAACGEIRPDDCAVIRTNLIKVFVVVGDLLQRPVELNDGGKKPLAFVCWSKGFSCVKDIHVLNTTPSLS